MRIGAVGAEKPVARLDDDNYVDLSDVVLDFDERVLRQRAASPSCRRRSPSATPRARSRFAGERIGAPIARPHQILCIGLNYRDHAAETGQDGAGEPILFTKSPNTLIGPNDDVRIPRGSTKPDWEVELGIVIGRRTSYLDSVEEARDAIAGYMRRQRRQRARLPDRARRPVVARASRPRPSTRRALAGHAGRDPRRARPRHVARRQRRAPSDRLDLHDDLRPVLHRPLPQPVHGARARRPDQHRHASRRRAWASRRRSGCRRAT